MWTLPARGHTVWSTGAVRAPWLMRRCVMLVVKLNVEEADGGLLPAGPAVAAPHLTTIDGIWPELLGVHPRTSQISSCTSAARVRSLCSSAMLKLRGESSMMHKAPIRIPPGP